MPCWRSAWPELGLLRDNEIAELHRWLTANAERVDQVTPNRRRRPPPHQNSTGKIYWANLGGAGNCCSGPGQIRSGNLDGSNPVTLVDQSTAGALGVAGPAGVALDLGANKFYWANIGGDSIWSASLVGTGPAQLFRLG